MPKTIDNDLDKTVVTFGFDTAVAFAMEAMDRLHSTAESHGRIMVVEVMGRYAGWIALHAGIAGSADAILIPEIPYDINRVAEKVRERDEAGRNFTMVVVAEGAKPVGGEVSVIEKELGRAERLGGAGQKVAEALEVLTGKEARTVVLGHLLRGGSPTASDRLISLRFGAAAVRALSEGQDGIMVAIDPPYVQYVPLTEVAGRMKCVPLDSDTMMTARDLGITFGDQGCPALTPAGLRPSTPLSTLRCGRGVFRSFEAGRCGPNPQRRFPLATSPVLLRIDDEDPKLRMKGEHHERRKRAARGSQGHR